MVFTKYLHEGIVHEGIAFLFRFELLIFGGKERLFGLDARVKSLF
jgi:hypothetical protein